MLLAGNPCDFAAPGKSSTACLQATETPAPTAVHKSGPQRNARADADKSKSKQMAVEAVAERESEEPAAAKSPVLLADPSAEMGSKVGCGIVTEAMELDHVSQGKLAWHACCQQVFVSEFLCRYHVLVRRLCSQQV